MSPRNKDVGVDMGLTEEEKKELLSLVRTTVESKARGLKAPNYKPVSDKLKEHRGVFVTIHKRGMLRGCIGWLQASEPLYETVERMSEAAAFNDPRFRPVSKDELEFLEYEISVLTPLRKIEDINEIQVGIHGLLLRNGGYSGLLLPQVAVERSWDRITFLEETCRKAGLSRQTWKDPQTEIFTFSADVF